MLEASANKDKRPLTCDIPLEHWPDRAHPIRVRYVELVRQHAMDRVVVVSHVFVVSHVAFVVSYVEVGLYFTCKNA